MKKYILLTYIIVSLIFRFLTANIYGIFLLLIGLYFIIPHFTIIKPFSPSELVLWSAEQPETMKALLLSSLMTIIGFVIAFQTATKNWKDQLVANLRVEASNDIDRTYSRLNELITSVQIYADTNLRILKKIENNAEEIEIFNDIHFVLSQTEKFLSERQELSLLHSRAFQLYGRYSMILFASSNTFDQLEKVNDFVAQVAKKMWILVPQVDLNSPDYLNHYLTFVDEEKYNDLSVQCSKSHPYIAAVSGSVRGKLTAGIAEYNLSLLYNFIRKGKFFLDVLFDIKKIDKENRTNGST